MSSERSGASGGRGEGRGGDSQHLDVLGVDAGGTGADNLRLRGSKERGGVSKRWGGQERRASSSFCASQITLQYRDEDENKVNKTAQA